MVEQVPEKDPARKDFTKGLAIKVSIFFSRTFKSGDLDDTRGILFSTYHKVSENVSSSQVHKNSLGAVVVPVSVVGVRDRNSGQKHPHSVVDLAITDNYKTVLDFHQEAVGLFRHGRAGHHLEAC